MTSLFSAIVGVRADRHKLRPGTFEGSHGAFKRAESGVLRGLGRWVPLGV